MSYIKTNTDIVGKQVVLTEKKKSLAGYFEEGTLVTITDIDETRGYTFTDSEGNKVIEAGWSGFREP